MNGAVTTSDREDVPVDEEDGAAGVVDEAEAAVVEETGLEGAEVDEAGSEPEVGDLAGRERRWPRALPWAVAVVAIVAAGVFAVLWQRAGSAERERTAVASTANHFLTALTNFKAATISTNVSQIRAFAVGDFASQVNQFFGPTTVTAIKNADVQSVGVVRAAFVEDIRGTTATVFGVVDETVTNRASAPRTEVLRVEVNLIHTSAGWKIDRVDILQSPNQGPLSGGG